MAAWGEWLPFPLPIDSGVGALRLWVELDQGQPRDVLADLELADVRARLASDLPPLELQHVQGRIGWKRDRERQEIHTRALQFHASDGTELPPTDFAFAHDDAAAGREARGSLSFARLDLAPLTALAGHLPLPESMRRDLARFAPRGVLIDGKYAWEGPAGAPVRFAASGAFDRLGFNAQDLFPGATGVSGSFEAHDTHGLLKLESRAMALDLPRVFVEPVVFDTAAGSVRWERGAEALRVSVDALAFANAHAAGTASGTWRSMPAGPGFADLRAQLTRASVEHLYRYVPHRISANVRDWLRSALQKGTSKDVRMALTGNLAEFPFPSNRSGHLLVTIKGQGGTLAYSPNWPPISEIDADVRFEGSKLTVDATSGKTLGAHIGRTRAEIADLQDPGSILRVTGEASGPVTEFLAFVAQTPVAGWTDHVAEKMKATGNGRLALSFDLPLRAPGNAKVDGQFQFTDARVDIAQFPPLTQASGRLEFDRQSLRATDIAGQFFGGAVKLQLSAGDGRLQRMRAASSASHSCGRIGTRRSSSACRGLPIGTRWSTRAPRPCRGRSSRSSRGQRSTCPRRWASRPRHRRRCASSVGSRSLRARTSSLTVDYGDAARVLLRRPPAGSGGIRSRAGAARQTAERPGDAGPQRAVDPRRRRDAEPGRVARRRTPMSTHGRSGGAAPTGAIELNGADIAASTLLRDRAHVPRHRSCRRGAPATTGASRSTRREAAGTAVWRGPAPAAPNGRAVVRLARLSAAAGDGADANGGGSEAARRKQRPARGRSSICPPTRCTSRGAIWASSSFSRGRSGPIGRSRFVLANDAGSHRGQRLVAHRARAADPSSTSRSKRRKPGAFLGRLGPARRDQGRADQDRRRARLGRRARAISTIQTLSGTFHASSPAPGSSPRSIPGIGKLLGVLSLQALPRRITLDFRDVFSEGFAFDDDRRRRARSQNGVMHTDDLRLVGPAAQRVTSPATSTSRSETQRLQRARAAVAVVGVLGRRRGAVPRQSAGRRRGRRRHAARAEDAEGSDRPDLQLRVRGERRAGPIRVVERVAARPLPHGCDPAKRRRASRPSRESHARSGRRGPDDVRRRRRARISRRRRR